MRKNVDYLNFDESDIEILPSGFMSLLANLTRTGIFVYQQIEPDGTVKILRQLRLAEEQDEEMLATLSGLPLTNNHPEELVSPENAEDYIVGMTSDRPKKILAPVQNGDDAEEEFIQQRVTIFNKDTMQDVKRRRKRQVSLGYTCELDFTPGVYKGQNYDCIQRNIRVNHVSLVQHARGGSNCKLLLDGKEQTINLDGTSIDEKNIPKEENVKVFILDGKEYTVEDSVHALLTSLKTERDEAIQNLDAKTKSVEKLTALKDDLESKIKVQNDADDADKFQAAVRERVALESKASKVLGEDVNLDGLSESEIKKKVVKKLRPSISLDGKSEDYIDARYEIALEDFNEDSSDEVSKKMGKKIQAKNDDSEDAFSAAEKARKAAWERDRNLYKGGK